MAENSETVYTESTDATSQDATGHFADLVCQSRHLWLPLFFLNVIFMILTLVGLFYAAPGTGEYVIAWVTVGLLGVPLCCMLGFIYLCRGR